MLIIIKNNEVNIIMKNEDYMTVKDIQNKLGISIAGAYNVMKNAFSPNEKIKISKRGAKKKVTVIPTAIFDNRLMDKEEEEYPLKLAQKEYKYYPIKELLNVIAEKDKIIDDSNFEIEKLESQLKKYKDIQNKKKTE